MNWTNQYLQTKYLNLISHIISQDCKISKNSADYEHISLKDKLSETQNSSLMLYLFLSVDVREIISQMKPARNSITPSTTASSAR